MNVPSQSDVRTDPVVRRLHDEDRTIFVVDFGPARDLHADIVGDTVMIVDDGSDEQIEFDLPAGEASTFMRNGVLTIEVRE